MLEFMRSGVDAAEAEFWRWQSHCMGSIVRLQNHAFYEYIISK